MINADDMGRPSRVSITKDFATTHIGRLGATVRSDMSETVMLVAALDMAERRILRLEMALRLAGIEVESTELPQ